MSESILNSVVTGGIARVTINRPHKRNALTRELIEQMLAAVRSIRDDQSVRLLVLAAEGTVFCAGMDLGEMEARATSPNAAEEWHQDSVVYRDLLWELCTLPIPTLAVVQGPALAGGLGLVLACDIVLAAEEAFFSLPEPKRGITAAVVTPLLVYRIGPGTAGYLLLSGRNMTAADAHRAGLCHELSLGEKLVERERELSSAILTGGSTSLQQTKQNLLACSAASLSADLDAGMQVSAAARHTPEAREGLTAFLEKRHPAWYPDGS
jgi:methylglutaconyl-CoA hydratase